MSQMGLYYYTNFTWIVEALLVDFIPHESYFIHVLTGIIVHIILVHGNTQFQNTHNK